MNSQFLNNDFYEVGGEMMIRDDDGSFLTIEKFMDQRQQTIHAQIEQKQQTQEPEMDFEDEADFSWEQEEID